MAGVVSAAGAGGAVGDVGGQLSEHVVEAAQMLVVAEGGIADELGAVVGDG
ncbi:hypothetical protein [Streptosporangium sp. NPDC049644]|uniref:hypothetical protein n=1 Tax=Streptosporangium sp. NPDC049644 TaxID=3155507 RepID=UPI003438CCA9